MKREEALEKIRKLQHWPLCICEQCMLAALLRRERRKRANRLLVGSRQ